MRYLKTYEKFINVNENELFYNFVDYYYNSNLITINEKFILEKYISNSLSEFLINENFFNKLKSRYDKAATVVKNIPDNAKSALNTIIDAAKTSVEFVQKIVKQLNDFIVKMLTTTVDNIKNQLMKDQNFTKHIKDANSRNKNGLLTDIKECKNILNFYKTKLSEIISSKLTTAFTQVVTSEDLPIEEKLNYIKEYLQMGKNVISSLIHGIEKIPPFSLLAKVKEMVEKGVNNVVYGLSYFTEQLGGPKFSIPVIASLIGVAFEYNIKGLAKHGLLDVIGLATVPVISILIKIIGYIATFTASVLVIDDICNFNLLTHKHEHKLSPAVAPENKVASPENQQPEKASPEKRTQQPEKVTANINKL